MLGGMNKALTLKLFILLFIGIVLCVVLGQIGGLVHERQLRQAEAAQSVEQSLAGPQALAGPLIMRACKETWAVATLDNRTGTESRDFWLSFAPDKLRVSGTLNPEVRYRGLFKVNTFASQLDVEAQWASLPGLNPAPSQPNGHVTCADAMVVVAVSDPRGIRSATLKHEGHLLSVLPGTTYPALHGGLHAPLPALRAEEPLTLSLKLHLVGSQRFGVVPAAEQTEVALTSSWRHPSFAGQFLPIAHEVGGAGFNARWEVSSLASTAIADLKNGRPMPDLRQRAHLGQGYGEPQAADKRALDVLAVELIDPVNPYVMSDRAIKYGLLFIALTFVTVGLTEVLTGRRVHPVQYLLVGLALSLFFLLLLSLAEHLPFLVSYLIAAAAASILLTQYAAAMLGGWRQGVAFGGGISLLYGALYVLLSREQTALVIGALLLFAVLAAVMALTRRLDWYKLVGAAQTGDTQEESAPSP